MVRLLVLALVHALSEAWASQTGQIVAVEAGQAVIAVCGVVAVVDSVED